MDNNNYIELLDRFMRNETTPAENDILLSWFKSHESKEDLDNIYNERWLEAADKTIPSDLQGRMFHQIKASIAKEEKNQAIVPVKKQLWRKWLAYAAMIAICVGIGVGSHLYTRTTFENQTIGKEYTVKAERGQRASITLPDGTKVWLNSHSEITYSGNYGLNDRKIFLKGEAFFEVAKQENLRFIVNADELDIEALGTSFNVKAYQEDDVITATLYTGKVKAMAGKEEVVLYPNQSVMFNRIEHKLVESNMDNSIYARMWLDNELSFDGQTLSEIAVILKRVSNVQIEFASEKIKQYKFSGVIRNNSLDNVIELISLTAPITYHSRGDTIVLSEKK